MKKKHNQCMKTQRQYHVVWEIDVSADSFEEAALLARKCQMPGTTATVFTVSDGRKQMDIDTYRHEKSFKVIRWTYARLYHLLGRVYEEFLKTVP